MSNHIVSLFFLVCLLASAVGAVCGIGGGVIIKPVLDATGVMTVSSVSFLSACTVLSMSIISVLKQIKQKDKVIDVITGTPLAVGAALGGVIGRELFQCVYIICPDENMVGAIQATLLVVMTIGTLVFTLCRNNVKTCHVENLILCCLIGMGLGILSSFLGIGGGPINLMVLSFFFSMNTKKAAANSLYIIMFSQAASVLSSILQQNIPNVPVLVFILMVAGGIAGGNMGCQIHNKISSKKVDVLFCGAMIIIIGINLYNVFKFSL